MNNRERNVNSKSKLSLNSYRCKNPSFQMFLATDMSNPFDNVSTACQWNKTWTVNPDNYLCISLSESITKILIEFSLETIIV